MLAKRIIFDFVLIIFAITLPWWVSLVLALAAIFYFEKFYETIFIGLIIDSIYGSSVVFSAFPYLITTISAVFALLIIHFKKNLIMY